MFTKAFFMKNYFLIAVTSLFMVVGNNATDTTLKVSDGNEAYLKNKPAGFASKPQYTLFL